MSARPGSSSCVGPGCRALARPCTGQSGKDACSRFLLAEFGTTARGVVNVDILVEPERPIGWEIVEIHDFLEELLGIKVDLVTAGALRRKPMLWESVQEDLVDV